MLLLNLLFRLTPALVVLCLAAHVPEAQAQRQMEPLGRGVVALRTGTSSAYIGWRLFATDPEDVAFNIYKSVNGAPGIKLNGSPLITTTDYTDGSVNFGVSNAWYVRPVIGGVEQAPSASFGLAAGAPTRQYLRLPLVQPIADGLNYDVKFCWVGDFDGDGEYDYLVDRLCTTANQHQYLQAYLRDGTLLWQVDMGPLSTNTSNAYEPDAAAISVGDKDNVTVYDLDGDGRAEVIFRAANGTVLPGAITVTTNNSTSQFLCVLDGLTGAERARALIPNLYFADGPLNCHAGIIYWDGVHPSILFDGENRVGSGNFQRQTVTWDFRNGQLTQRWVRGDVPGENQSEGHQLRIADVNQDGRDDLVQIGSVVTDNVTNGVLIYDTELQHGDRYHITDIDPERPGLEMFAIQQNNPTLLATSLQDMGSGTLYKKWYSGSVVDVGRGITLDMTPSHRGCEMYSTQPGIFNAKGEQIYANNIWAPEGVWWDADLLREFEDGAGSGALNPVINKFNPATGNADRIFSIYNDDGAYSTHQAYGGRAAFWGDLFGDWREELVLVGSDYQHLRIYTTKIPATNRIYCLMQNPMYRVQSTYKGYYQASYVDYYLGNDMPAPPIPPVSDANLVWRGGGANVWDTTTANWLTNNLWISNTIQVPFVSGKSVLFDFTGSNSAPITLSGSLTPSDVRVWSSKDYTFAGPGALTGAMAFTKAGSGKLIFSGTNTYTGRTLVGEGQFVVNGSLPNSPVTVRGGVWLSGRLGGNGVVGSAIRLEEGGGVSPGQGTNSAGTLTVNANVTMAGRTRSDFDLSNNPGGANDLLNITGNLTLQGTNTFVIRKLNATLPPGSVYPLINYTGTLSGGLNNLAVSGLEGTPYALTNPPNQIALVIVPTRSPTTLNWTGGQNGNAWDLITTSNFLNGASKDVFVPGDTVRFDSVGVSNLTASLTGFLNAGAVVVDSTANYTLAGSGSIIGAGGLSKLNSGTLTISAMNNTFTGPTTVSGGMLVVPELDAVGAPSPLGNPSSSPVNLVLGGGATLRVTGESYTDRGLMLNSGTQSLDVFNSADQVTMAGLITGSGALQKLGGGTLAISGNNNYTGGTVIKAGTITLGGDTANQYGLGTGAVTLDGGTLVMFNDSGSYNHTYWNLIVPNGSSGTLYSDDRCYLHGTLTGGGTFNFRVNYVRTELDGNWAGFTGQINVFTSDGGGDFRINNSSGYGNAAVDFGAGIYAYHMSGNSVAIGALSGSAGSTLSGTPWTVGAKNTSTTFGGVITGNSLTKVGTGTLTLTGASTYGGTTTVSAGTLMVNGNNGGATNTVTVNSAGTLAGTGTVGGNTTVSGRLAPGNNGIGTLTLNGTLALAGGSTTLVEVNKSTGAKDLISVASTLTYGGNLTVSNLAGTFVNGDSYKIFNAASYNGSFTSSNIPPLSAGLAWDFSSLITNGTIAVVPAPVVGPQSLTWKGDGNGNRWDIGGTPNWLNASLAPSLFNNGDTVTFNDSGSNNTAIVLASAVQPAALTVNATKNYVFAGPGSIAGTNFLLKSGTGTLSLAVPGTYSGATTISGGTVELLNLAAGLKNRWSFNGNLADSVGAQNAAIVDVGINDVALTSSNVTMSGGTKLLSDYVDLGDNLVPKDGSPLTIEIWATPHSIQNWSRIFDFGASTTENVFMSWTRGTTLAQDRVEWVDTAGTNTTNDTCQPYTLGVEFHIAMVIEPGAGAGGTTRVTWYRSPTTNSSLGVARGTFDTANTLAGLTDVNCWLGYSQWPDNAANASYNEVRLWNRALSAADLQLLHNAGPDASLVGALPNGTVLSLTGASSKLDNQSGQTQTVGSLTGVAGSEVKLTSGGLNTGGDNASTAFSGILSGTNGLTKSGTGTLALTGNSTYTGATLVSGGTLQVNGNNAAASGAVTVASGATLGGTGILGGATTIQPGGTLSPGTSIGALTFNSGLTLSGKTLMEISHTPLTNDVIIKSGALSYSGMLEITHTSGTLVAGDRFKLFDAASYNGAFSGTMLPTLPAGLVWNLSKLNVSGTLWVVSTNPPSLSPPSANGGNFNFGGTGGTPGWDYYLLSSTNLSLPLASWERIVTNQFDASGNCAVSVPVNPSQPVQFYRLQVP